MKNNEIIFDETLKKMRKKNKLTQEQIAALIKIDRSAYAYYETGKTKPDINTLDKLCRVYGITIDEFIAMCKGSDKTVLHAAVPPIEYRTNGDSSFSATLPQMSPETSFEQFLIFSSRLFSEKSKQALIAYINKLLDEQN